MLSLGLGLLFVLRHTLGDGAAGLFENLAGDPLLAIPTTVLDRSPQGRLSWPALMATLDEAEGWQTCASPEQIGTVSVDVSVDAQGAAATAGRATTDDAPKSPGPAPVGIAAEAEACVIAFAGGLRFSPPEGGPARVRLHFHFEPGRVAQAP